jgi:ankyrin repeat protein
MGDVEEADLEAIFKAARWAAYRGNLEEVRRLVQENRMLLNAEWYSSTLLKAAAEGGRLEVVRYLLDEGADINLSPAGCATALEEACAEGHTEVASLLLARGADATAGSDGLGPLMYAAEPGHTDIVDLLLAHGCGDIDHQSPGDGMTVLHDACYNGHAGVVRLLLGAGADPHLVNSYGRTPLWFAAQEGHAECVAVLQVIALACLRTLQLGLQHLLPSLALLSHTGVGVPLPPLQGPPPPRCDCHTCSQPCEQLWHHWQQPGAGVRRLQGGGGAGAA